MTRYAAIAGRHGTTRSLLCARRQRDFDVWRAQAQREHTQA